MLHFSAHALTYQPVKAGGYLTQLAQYDLIVMGILAGTLLVLGINIINIGITIMYFNNRKYWKCKYTLPLMGRV